MNQFLLHKDGEEIHDTGPFASSLNARLSFLFLTRNVQNLADHRQLDYLMVLVGPVLIDKFMFNIWTSANMGMWQKMVVKQIDNNFPLDVKMFKTWGETGFTKQQQKKESP